MAPKDLWMYAKCRRLNHFTSKLTNNIQNLVEVPMDSLNLPPKGLVNHPKPLVMSYYM
jgi:hypothetical protein